MVQTQYRTGIEHEQNLLAAIDPAVEVTGTGGLTMGEAQQQEQEKQSLAGWSRKDERGMGELGVILPGIEMSL